MLAIDCRFKSKYDAVALHAIVNWLYLSTKAIFLLYQFM